MISDIKIYERFSPTIMESKVSKRFIDIVNTSGDAVFLMMDYQRSLIFQIVLLVKFQKKLKYLFLMKMIENITETHSRLLV